MDNKDIVFGTKWFERHQSKLLWFLNNPIFKKISRKILGVYKDCEITQILPNSISYSDRYFIKNETIFLERTTDFLRKDPYAKRLRKYLMPLWSVMHFFDWLFLDRFSVAQNYSFGFSTLNASPAAGAASPVDGRLRRHSVNETLATIRAGAGSDASDTTTVLDPGISASTTTNQFGQLNRALVFFDTAALTSAAVISAASFTGTGTNKNNGLGGSPKWRLGSGNAASNSALAASDFAQANFGTTSFGELDYASFSSSGANVINLNASGLAAISKTGITKLSLQCDWDQDNSFGGSWSSGQSMFMIVSSADGATAPVLSITYTIPVGPAGMKTHNGLAAASVKTIEGLAIASVKTKNGLA